MYKQNRIEKSQLLLKNVYVGETIEHKVERIISNKEPIKDGAPLIYTERKNGVMAAYDIRTDKFDIAIGATDAIAKDNAAKRKAAIMKRDKDFIDMTKPISDKPSQ